ncbi:hypothetical protein QQF64_014054 [Cirrhinus molitorella]|uniref:Uncharacterized protein n=1 Tax=Cirrhinus molitorella TaxID=172907 RepID=A0ABR3LX32_9TELE
MGWMDTLETSPCWLCQTDLITSASRRACVNTLMIAQTRTQTITLIYSVTEKTIVVSGKAGVCFCLLFVSHSYASLRSASVVLRQVYATVSVRPRVKTAVREAPYQPARHKTDVAEEKSAAASARESISTARQRCISSRRLTPLSLPLHSNINNFKIPNNSSSPALPHSAVFCLLHYFTSLSETAVTCWDSTFQAAAGGSQNSPINSHQPDKNSLDITEEHVVKALRVPGWVRSVGTTLRQLKSEYVTECPVCCWLRPSTPSSARNPDCHIGPIILALMFHQLLSAEDKSQRQSVKP